MNDWQYGGFVLLCVAVAWLAAGVHTDAAGWLAMAAIIVSAVNTDR